MTVVSTHLLLGKLRRCQIIVGRYELLVAFARADMPALHRIVMHLALSLYLLALQLGAVLGSRFSPRLVKPSVELDRGVDLGGVVIRRRDIQRV